MTETMSRPARRVSTPARPTQPCPPTPARDLTDSDPPLSPGFNREEAPPPYRPAEPRQPRRCAGEHRQCSPGASHDQLRTHWTACASQVFVDPALCRVLEAQRALTVVGPSDPVTRLACQIRCRPWVVSVSGGRLHTAQLSGDGALKGAAGCEAYAVEVANHDAPGLEQ